MYTRMDIRAFHTDTNILICMYTNTYMYVYIYIYVCVDYIRT